MASRTCRVYGAAPPSCRWSGRASQDKKEIDAATAAKLEDAAQQKQFDLRTEPTDTPPGEKTTDAYNTFWRDGYWFKIPMTISSYVSSSRSTGRADASADCCWPGCGRSSRRGSGQSSATGPEDRPLSSRCIRPAGAPVRRLPVQVPEVKESTLEIIREPRGGGCSWGSPLNHR